MVAASGRGNQADPASGPVTITSGPWACGFESLAIATGDSDSTPDSLDRPRVTRTLDGDSGQPEHDFCSRPAGPGH